MKIIEWNCQGAFRKKHNKVLSYSPDILIIPECENVDKLKFGNLMPTPNNFYWHGENSNRGIGIFSYSDYQIELQPFFNPNFRFIIPLKITKGPISLTLFAIWAMNDKLNYEARYIGQIWLAINFYSTFLGSDTMLIGDFNSNKIWDYKDRVGNHSDVVSFLCRKNIHSLYHHQNEIDQGVEKDSTFFLYRNVDKHYHIDYCFASKSIIDTGFTISIGNYQDWKEFSDHSPLFIELNDPRAKTSQ
jgi:exonuclease III